MADFKWSSMTMSSMEPLAISDLMKSVQDLQKKMQDTKEKASEDFSKAENIAVKFEASYDDAKTVRDDLIKLFDSINGSSFLFSGIVPGFGYFDYLRASVGLVLNSDWDSSFPRFSDNEDAFFIGLFSSGDFDDVKGTYQSLMNIYGGMGTEEQESIEGAGKKVTTWTPGKKYSADDLVIPRIANDHQYKATSEGTSGSTEPTWPVSGEVDDSSVTWEENGPINAFTPIGLSVEKSRALVVPSSDFFVPNWQKEMVTRKFASAQPSTWNSLRVIDCIPGGRPIMNKLRDAIEGMVVADPSDPVQGMIDEMKAMKKQIQADIDATTAMVESMSDAFGGDSLSVLVVEPGKGGIVRIRNEVENAFNRSADGFPGTDKLAYGGGAGVVLVGGGGGNPTTTYSLFKSLFGI